MSRLEALGVGVSFSGRKVLDRVDLALVPGSVTALLGPNGAGKSTLLACLAGLRRPDQGEVKLGGSSISAIAPRQRARALGYLPQSPEIAWRLDVETFVRLGRTAHRGVFGESPEDGRAAAAAMDRTGLSSFARRDVTSLSGGERARALIARALAGEPRWLLADEPLSGLDLSHQLDAAALLRAVAADGVGVVLTLHDLAFALRAADRVVLLSHGRLIADGPPRAALSSKTLSLAYGVDAEWLEGKGGLVLDVLRKSEAPAYA